MTERNAKIGPGIHCRGIGAHALVVIQNLYNRQDIYSESVTLYSSRILRHSVYLSVFSLYCNGSSHCVHVSLLSVKIANTCGLVQEV